MNQDRQHLQLLSIFHYVVGGILALLGLLPGAYILLGAFLLAVPPPPTPSGQPAPPLEVLGGVVILIGVVLVLLFWVPAFCLVLAGRFLTHRRHYVFCFVAAALACLHMPFGTVLGVFTIVVLCRPSVKRMFEPDYRDPSEWDEEDDDPARPVGRAVPLDDPAPRRGSRQVRRPGGDW